MELSLKKYLLSALNWLIPFAFLEILICFLYFTGNAGETLFACINITNFICLLPPGAYYLFMFFIYKKKCGNFTPTEGVIMNWEVGFFRGTGRVIVKVGEKEYSSSACFNHEEAKEMVGETISYAIIDDTLFIYGIKENKD